MVSRYLLAQEQTIGRSLPEADEEERELRRHACGSRGSEGSSFAGRSQSNSDRAEDDDDDDDDDTDRIGLPPASRAPVDSYQRR
jgi:hypothetical protein